MMTAPENTKFDAIFVLENGERKQKGGGTNELWQNYRKKVPFFGGEKNWKSPVLFSLSTSPSLVIFLENHCNDRSTGS